MRCVPKADLIFYTSSVSDPKIRSTDRQTRKAPSLRWYHDDKVSRINGKHMYFGTLWITKELLGTAVKT